MNGRRPLVHRDAAAGETMLVWPASDDGLLRVELLVEAAHRGPPAHIHPGAVETFTVLDGEVGIRVGRRRWTLRRGESASVPAGVPHAYTGVPGVAARVLVELDPPGRMAEFFAAIYGLPPADRVARTGAPRLRAAAAVLTDHADDVRLPGPGAVTVPLLRLLARRSS